MMDMEWWYELRKYIPNALTILRFLLVPFYILLFLYDAHFWAYVLFLVASITDYVDGRLARRWKATTEFGKYSDPLADKLIVLSAYFLLALKVKWLYISPIWVVLIAFRDFYVTAVRTISQSLLKKSFPTLFFARLKTFLQMFTLNIIYIFFLILYYLQHIPMNYTIFEVSKHFNIPLPILLIPLILTILVVIVTVISGIQYAFVFGHIWKEHKEGK